MLQVGELMLNSRQPPYYPREEIKLCWIRHAMNKYEKRALAERRAVARSSITLGGAGIALLVVIVLIVWLNSSAPSGYFSKIVIGLAVVLLAVRMLSRFFRGGTSRAARPDPKSTLKLD
jgi:hypothetical protein